MQGAFQTKTESKLENLLPIGSGPPGKDSLNHTGMGMLQLRVGPHRLLNLVFIPLDCVLPFFAVHIESVELCLCALTNGEPRRAVCVLVLGSSVVNVMQNVVVEARIQDGIEDGIAL